MITPSMPATDEWSDERNFTVIESFGNPFEEDGLPHGVIVTIDASDWVSAEMAAVDVAAGSLEDEDFEPLEVTDEGVVLPGIRRVRLSWPAGPQ